MNVLDKKTYDTHVETQQHYFDENVEKRFKKKYQKICSSKIDKIIRIAKILKQYVLREEHRLNTEGIENLLKNKNYGVTHVNVSGKVYVLSLRIVSLIFLDDTNLFYKNQIYVVDLGFNDLFKFYEEKRETTKKRFFLKTNILLGKGGNHLVYKGYDVIKNREVAVRTSFGERVNWIKDVRIHRQLSDKKTPAIVKIHSVMTDEKILFLELFENHLNKLKAKDLNNEKIVSVIFQLLTGIKIFHDKDLVIRDIKPDNILYKVENGSIKISLCDLESVGKSSSFDYVGTYSYLPIDAFNQLAHPDLKKIDCWSLGLTILNFITGNKNCFSHFSCVGLIDWINVQISNIFKNDLKSYFESLEMEFPNIRSNKLYNSLKSDLKETVKLIYDIEDNNIIASKIINIVMKGHVFYSYWIDYYTDIYECLNTCDHPPSKIIYHLMDLNVENRWTVDDALRELKAFIDSNQDLNALTSFNDLIAL